MNVLYEVLSREIDLADIVRDTEASLEAMGFSRDTGFDYSALGGPKNGIPYSALYTIIGDEITVSAHMFLNKLDRTTFATQEKSAVSVGSLSILNWTLEEFERFEKMMGERVQVRKLYY